MYKNILVITTDWTNKITGANYRAKKLSIELSKEYKVYLVSSKKIFVYKNSCLYNELDNSIYIFAKLIFFTRFYVWFSDIVMYSLIPLPRLIFTIHDMKEWTIYSRKSILKKILIKICAIKASKVITVSKFSKNEIKKYLNINAFVIPNGTSDEKVDIDNTKDKNYVLYISNFAINKGHELLIKNIKAFHNLKLYFIGVPLDNYGHDIVKLLNNFNNVKIFNNVTEKEKFNLISNSKFNIFPSQYEGYGIPIIESIKYNKKILVQTHNCFEQFVGCDLVKFIDYNQKIKSYDIEWALNITDLNNNNANNYFESWESVSKKVLELL